jgi:hypothetical protein
MEIKHSKDKNCCRKVHAKEEWVELPFFSKRLLRRLRELKGKTPHYMGRDTISYWVEYMD